MVKLSILLLLDNLGGTRRPSLKIHQESSQNSIVSRRWTQIHADKTRAMTEKRVFHRR